MSAHTQEESLAVAAKGMAAPREVLTLRLGGEEYGIDILRVQEIRSFEQPTRLAGAPPHVLGVTNLRGVIVPIVDLRCRFGLDAGCGSDTVTVVLGLGGRTVGAVVDAVSDVVALTPAQIKPAPEFSGTIDAGHITGIPTLAEGERAHVDPAGYRGPDGRAQGRPGLRARPCLRPRPHAAGLAQPPWRSVQPTLKKNARRTKTLCNPPENRVPY